MLMLLKMHFHCEGAAHQTMGGHQCGPEPGTRLFFKTFAERKVCFLLLQNAASIWAYPERGWAAAFAFFKAFVGH